ncbi:hypothetical protein ACWDXG_11400, partial [Streptomyces sp. NPDC003395]
VPSSALPPDAAAAVYDTFIRFLRNSTRTLLVARRAQRPRLTLSAQRSALRARSAAGACAR